MNDTARLQDRTAAMRAARAIDALRRGWSVYIRGEVAGIAVRAIETATDFEASAILISASRAATLKLINQSNAASARHPVLIAMPSDLIGELDAALAMAIADPTLDLAYPMKGPFTALPLPDIAAANAAMELARHAGILPAFLLCTNDDGDSIAAADIAAFAGSEMINIATRARLPVSASANAEIVAFRSAADATDHIALVIGDRDESPPLVRLHSECLTGDVLGSLKCDCGPQLHEAMHRMTEARWGVLLYLRQEGRGIGLINKLRAYALQDQGFDTVDANTRLGFAVDARDFSIAARMLQLLGIDAIRLLTNNPAKVAGLEAQSVTVIECVPLQIAANAFNQDYLNTKRDRTGHTL